MVVTLFLAIAAMVIGYAAFGQGGGVAGMVFFGVLLIGASLGVLRSVMQRSDLR
jgi:ribose/xylose/arabinose/galactoside ABC-type transport system permease subunit